MSKVTIDFDMLTIMSWLCKKYDTRFISDVFEQVSSDRISTHLSWMIMDHIPYKKRAIFEEYLFMMRPLTIDELQYFREIGFLVGENLDVPKALKARFKLYFDLQFN